MARPSGFEQQSFSSSTKYLGERAYNPLSSPSSVKRPAEENFQSSPHSGEPMIFSQQGSDIKRQRRGSASSSPEPSHQTSKGFKDKSGFEQPSESAKTGNSDVDRLTWPTMIDWRVDPFEVDPESSNYHMNLYFDHINSTTYCMFPRNPFFKWCQTSRDKTADDRMIIYSLLAMGAVFSVRPDHKTICRKLLNAAEFAVQQSLGQFSLQLAQSRLILALLHFSLGNSTKAWDYCGAGIRAVCAMKLNIEGAIHIAEGEEMEYGFTKAALEECQRRTFWSAFLMDVSHSSELS